MTFPHARPAERDRARPKCGRGRQAIEAHAGLTPPDRDLRTLAVASEIDHFYILVRFARDGLGMSITLVAGGLLIAGELASTLDFAKDLDAKIDAGLSKWHTEERDDIGVLRDALEENSFTKLVEKGLAERKKIEDEVMAMDEGAELPDDLEREWIDASSPPPAITLRNVTVYKQRGASTRPEAE